MDEFANQASAYEQAKCAQDVAWQQKAEYSGLCGTPITDEEAQRRQREYLAQNAVNVLQQARQIRADPALMSEVRAYIRKLLDEGAALLDDLG